MSRRISWTAAGALVACVSMNGAVAQSPGMGSGSNPAGGMVGSGNQMGRTMTQDEFNKLQDYADQSRRLTKSDKDAGRTLSDLLAEDKAAAAKLAAEMPLSCDVKEAILAAEGDITVDGKAVKTKSYEAACMNGMGYFLVSQEPGAPYGISCFAADASGKSDTAAGRKPGAMCSIPANADLKVMATTMARSAGIDCAVRDYRWVGQSTKARVEYVEIVCSDNFGYMLQIALPGSNAPVRVSTCRDAGMKGLPCKLSDSGPIVSLQTFQEELTKRSIACDADTDKDIRALGQENKQKRYVVEFRCSQRPAGTIAYIPLDGNKAPFEVLDCAAAQKRGAMCVLNKKQ